MIDINSETKKQLREDCKFAAQIDGWMASEESDAACKAVGATDAIYVDSVTVSSNKLAGPMLDNASRTLPVRHSGLILLKRSDGSVVAFKLEKLHEYPREEWRAFLDREVEGLLAEEWRGIVGADPD